MNRALLAIMLLAIAPASAAAEESRLAVMFGHGATYQTVRHLGWDVTELAPTLRAMVGFRPAKHLAVGLLTGASRFEVSIQHSRNVDGVARGEDYGVTSFDAALAVQLESGRCWAMPWIGHHFTRSTIRSYVETDGKKMVDHDGRTDWAEGFASLGVSAGFDVLLRDPDRLTVFGAVQTYLKPDELAVNRYTSMTIGIAYRR